MINKKTDIKILIVEVLFYFSIVAREFGTQLGILNIQGLSGAIIVFAGMVCLFIMLSQHDTFPGVFYIGLVITGIVTLTTLRVYGSEFIKSHEIQPMLFWPFQMLMALKSLKMII